MCTSGASFQVLSTMLSCLLRCTLCGDTPALTRGGLQGSCASAKGEGGLHLRATTRERGAQQSGSFVGE